MACVLDRLEQLGAGVGGGEAGDALQLAGRRSPSRSASSASRSASAARVSASSACRAARRRRTVAVDPLLTLGQPALPALEVRLRARAASVISAASRSACRRASSRVVETLQLGLRGGDFSASAATPARIASASERRAAADRVGLGLGQPAGGGGHRVRLGAGGGRALRGLEPQLRQRPPRRSAACASSPAAPPRSRGRPTGRRPRRRVIGRGGGVLPSPAIAAVRRRDRSVPPVPARRPVRPDRAGGSGRGRRDRTRPRGSAPRTPDEAPPAAPRGRSPRSGAPRRHRAPTSVPAGRVRGHAARSPVRRTSARTVAHGVSDHHVGDRRDADAEPPARTGPAGTARRSPNRLDALSAKRCMSVASRSDRPGREVDSSCR